MSKIISIHSFRGGTGKSNTTANIAGLLAAEGRRVGVIDTDIQSPGIHVLFGLAGTEINHSLNDYLWGKCDIEQAAYDVTANAGEGLSGQIFLIPSSIDADEIVDVLRDGYDVTLLTKGFHKLIKVLDLDVLLIDTHPGLNEETLYAIAISHGLVIIMRPDHQDYEGTSVAVKVARSLEVPRMMLVVNKVPSSLDPAQVKAQIEQTYACEVAAILPLSDDMVSLASAGIFALRFPDHALTALYKEVAAKLDA
jgi:MinD-like ATPase involved in chromosome partitioning or flagellar assembly